MWHKRKFFYFLIVFCINIESAYPQNEDYLTIQSEEFFNVLARFDSMLNDLSSERPEVWEGYGCASYSIPIPKLSMDLPLQSELKEIEKEYEVFKSAFDSVEDPLVDILMDDTAPAIPRKIGVRYYKTKLGMSDLDEHQREVLKKAIAEISPFYIQGFK